MSVLLDTLYKKVACAASAVPLHRLPKIGISANRKEGTSCIAEPYFQSVVMAGGAPILIPVIIIAIGQTLTMTLIGLWHGATVNYLIWGL